MLIGEYTHILDTKKRLSLPSKFRKEIGKKVVVTRGLDNCLFVYPIPQWKKEAEKLNNIPKGTADARGYNRVVLASATETDVDSIGRILLPERLKEFASLQEKVSVIGVNDHIELWNEAAWITYRDGVELRADSLAEKLGESGVL
jgi:MraZ protein